MADLADLPSPRSGDVRATSSSSSRRLDDLERRARSEFHHLEEPAQMVVPQQQQQQQQQQSRRRPRAPPALDLPPGASTHREQLLLIHHVTQSGHLVRRQRRQYEQAAAAAAAVGVETRPPSWSSASSVHRGTRDAFSAQRVASASSWQSTASMASVAGASQSGGVSRTNAGEALGAPTGSRTTSTAASATAAASVQAPVTPTATTTTATTTDAASAAAAADSPMARYGGPALSAGIGAAVLAILAVLCLKRRSARRRQAAAEGVAAVGGQPREGEKRRRYRNLEALPVLPAPLPTPHSPPLSQKLGLNASGGGGASRKKRESRRHTAATTTTTRSTTTGGSAPGTPTTTVTTPSPAFGFSSDAWRISPPASPRRVRFLPKNVSFSERRRQRTLSGESWVVGRPQSSYSFTASPTRGASPVVGASPVGGRTGAVVNGELDADVEALAVALYSVSSPSPPSSSPSPPSSSPASPASPAASNSLALYPAPRAATGASTLSASSTQPAAALRRGQHASSVSLASSEANSATSRHTNLNLAGSDPACNLRRLIDVAPPHPAVQPSSPAPVAHNVPLQPHHHYDYHQHHRDVWRHGPGRAGARGGAGTMWATAI